MLKGMTAEFLLRRVRARRARATRSCSTPPPAASAASPASGRGRWARASSAPRAVPRRCARAVRKGCDEVIDYKREDVVARVKDAHGRRRGRVRRSTPSARRPSASLDSLRPRGMLVLFGQSSGVVPPFEPASLAAQGSLFLTRPALRALRRRRAKSWSQSAASAVRRRRRGARSRSRSAQTYPLAEAAAAHRATWRARETIRTRRLLPPGP